MTIKPAAVVQFTPHPTKPATKNCWRFEAVTTEGAPPAVTSLYLQKWVSASQPSAVTVSIEVKA